MKTKGRRQSSNIDDRSSLWSNVKTAAKNAFGLANEPGQSLVPGMEEERRTTPKSVKPMLSGMESANKKDRELRARTGSVKTPIELELEAERRHDPLTWKRSRSGNNTDYQKKVNERVKEKLTTGFAKGGM